MATKEIPPGKTENCENRMETLRTDWTTWKQVIGKETGLGWNHQIGNIDANASWWDAKIRVSIINIEFLSHEIE